MTTRPTPLISMFFLFAMAAMTALANEPREKWVFASRMYSDPKARHVGDLLTVLIVESASSSREASTKTGKKTSTSGQLSITHPNIDNAPSSWTNISIPKWGVDAQRGFEGGGEMKNEEKITTTISARVMEVLPNGNLLIEGKRSLTVMGEDMQYILTGTVRPSDVSRENTVRSTSIADLSVQYSSTGPITKSQKKGVFDTLVDFINPF